MRDGVSGLGREDSRTQGGLAGGYRASGLGGRVAGAGQEGGRWRESGGGLGGREGWALVVLEEWNRAAVAGLTMPYHMTIHTIALVVSAMLG